MQVASTIVSLLAASAVTTEAVATVANEQPHNNMTTTAATTVDNANTPCWITLGGVDIKGRDIGSVREANKYQGCRDHCAANSQCKWYTWTDFEGGTCWLKSGDTLQVDAVGARAVSGFVRYMDACPKIAFVLSGLDLVGGDIGDAPGATVDACFDICRDWPGCKGYVWSNADKGPTCWLKQNALALKGATGMFYAEMLQTTRG